MEELVVVTMRRINGGELHVVFIVRRINGGELHSGVYCEKNQWRVT